MPCPEPSHKCKDKLPQNRSCVRNGGVIRLLECVFVNDREFMARVRAIEGRLYRVAQSILWRQADSMDAVQEAVFRGWLKKSSLKDPARFEAWLMQILVNQCRDMLRRRKREGAALTMELSSEDRLCEDLQLRLALKRLPDKYRLPLILHHMEGWSIDTNPRLKRDILPVHFRDGGVEAP